MSENLQWAAQGLLQGAGAALNSLKPQYELARKGLTENDYYKPFYEQGQSGVKLYGDALGVNGADGAARAASAFQAGPGYQFQLNQGLDALNRTAASRGMLASGNNTQDLMSFAQGTANKAYGDWLTRLGGLSDMGMSAAGGSQQRQGAISSLDYGYGADQAGIWQNTMKNIADVTMQDKERKKDNVLSAILGGVNLAGGLLGGFMR